MEKIGIICEYNPFHNGHLYHINKIKKLYPDSIIVLVMSGYFTERGDVSLISKYNKTKITLEYGVDLVLELPTLYTLNSADFFGDEAVKILNDAGVEKLVFGSECNDIELLKKAASVQINNSEFDKLVKSELDKGVNYPTALSKACNYTFSSNDLLGISYIKSIIKNKFEIEPITIKRTNDFNDKDLDDKIVSAENIRERINKCEDITKYIPKYNLNYINSIDYNKLFELLKYKIITDSEIESYLGVDEGLGNKLKKEINNSNNLEELINNVKSKRYTYVRIKRMLMHILLGIKKDDMKVNNEYVRILGFTSNGRKYLSTLENDNLVYKYDNRVRDIELISKDIYYTLTGDKSTYEETLNKPIEKGDI